MEVNGQLHTPATSPTGKEPSVCIGQKAKWAAEPVWMQYCMFIFYVSYVIQNQFQSFVCITYVHILCKLCYTKPVSKFYMYNVWKIHMHSDFSF